MHIAVTATYAVALLLYAVWFGIAIYLLIAPCYDKLSGQAFIEWFQKIDPYMKVRAPQLSFAQLGVTVLLLILMRERWSSLAFGLVAFGLLTTVIATAIAVRGNVPLNRQMDRWSPTQPPDGWERIRDQWLGFHRQRGLAEIAGFVALLVSAFLHLGAA
jgi:hypothetical protein